MKTDKLYKEIITDFLKINNDFMFGKCDDFVAIVKGGNALFLVDKRLFPFDTSVLLKGRDLLREEFVRSLFNHDGYREGHITDITRTITNRGCKSKTTLNIIKSEICEVYVNSAYLAYFENPQFEIKNPKSGVMVYENGCIRGFILPVFVNNSKEG